MTDRLATITANSDLNGKAIEVGTRVRSFDFPLMTSEGPLGLELEGAHAAYMEGAVEAIGEDDLEGCRRYRIVVDKIVSRGAPYPVTDFFGENRPVIYPPLNGTPSFGGKCFGVMVA